MDLSQLASSLVQQERAQAAEPGVRGPLNLPSLQGKLGARFAGIQATPVFEMVYPMVKSEERTSALLATTLWQAMLSSSRFVTLLARMGIRLPSRGDGRVLIVMHEDEELTRYDLLLLLSPILFPQQAISIPLVSLLGQMDLSGSEVASFFDDWHKRIRARLTQLHQSGELSAEELQHSLSLYDNMASQGGVKFFGELFRVQPFSLMVAPMPRMIRTDNVPAPAVGITLEAGGQLSCTVGVVTKDAGGRVGVTTCLHGVVPEPDQLYDLFSKHGAACVVGKTVYVDGVAGTIGMADLITDSCFIEVSLPAVPGAGPVKGPMRDKSPYPKEPVSFHGKVSMKKGTFVTGLDPSIPFVSRGEQARVYTQAVTNPGDSGAALVNSDDFVLGFCHRRTGLGEPIEFAEWIWAHSVYSALKLERT